MQLNSRRHRDQGAGAHSSHDVIPITLDDSNHNTRPTIRIADARRHQASPIATRMFMNTDSARTSHSFVSLMSSSGVPVEEIARLAGHSNTRTTEVVYRRELRPVLTTGAEAMDRLFPS